MRDIMQESPWTLAIEEFLHVGSALIIVIAVISVLTGIIREYIPQDKLQKKLAKNERKGPIIGALFGTLTPFCSASMVPVVMGMVEMGASMGTIFGFLVSAPLCNFVVVGLIFATFGFQVASIYLALTLGGAILAGYVINLTPLRNEVRRNVSEPSASCSKRPATTCGTVPEPSPGGCGCGVGAAEAPTTSHRKRLRDALRFAWALFKRIMPYVLIGVVVSALSAAFLPAEIVETYVGNDNWYAIPIAAVIGVPLYLRIEMAIPLLQVLIAKGMGMGPAMALLIGGTGASLPEIAIISAVLKPKAVAAFVVTVCTLAMIGGGLFLAIA